MLNKTPSISVKELLFSSTATLLIIFVCLIIPNDYYYAGYVAVFLLTFSALNVIFCRNNKMLLVLFSIIFYINLSVSIPGFINHGQELAVYQRPLWTSDYATLYAKSLLIVAGVFSIFLYDTHNYKDYNAITIDYNFVESYNNPFLALFSLVILILIFIFCFDGTSVLRGGAYSSNENALYEYSVFFFALAWLYGSSRGYIRIIWYILAAYYIIIGVLTGDRSSCFMLIVMIVLYVWKKANVFRVALYSVLGIIFANSIAIFRNLNEFSGIKSILDAAFSSGSGAFLSDTAYYSCHTGLTILAYSDIYEGSKTFLFFKWVVSLFSGSLIIKDNSYELVNVAKLYNYNGGGGMFPAYFYFYGGLFGVAIASIMTGAIIKRVYYKSTTKYSKILRYIIPSMSLRWYLYSPTSLFRSCLINFGIICIFFYFIDNTFFKKNS